MTEVKQVQYTAKAHTTGGRDAQHSGLHHPNYSRTLDWNRAVGRTSG
jgi:hypothetical protein